MLSVSAKLLDTIGRTEIATIQLNNHRFVTHNPLNSQFDEKQLVWGFNIVAGNSRELEQIWSHQRPIVLHLANHNFLSAQIAAFPRDQYSSGLLQIPLPDLKRLNTSN